MEEARVAVISIIAKNQDSIAKLNELLHEYRDFVVGRMGIPYKEKDINIICIALDAPQDVINALCGSLGKLDGVTAKATYSKI